MVGLNNLQLLITIVLHDIAVIVDSAVRITVTHHGIIILG